MKAMDMKQREQLRCCPTQMMKAIDMEKIPQ